jgi:rare lipoprotein A
MSLRAPMPLRRPCQLRHRGLGRLAGVLVAAVACATSPSIAQAASVGAKAKARHHAAPGRAAPGATAAQVGWASVYARQLAGRRMANGAPMRPDRHNAASPNLPLGSTALVTNLANGARVRVTITDRGPFVRGRIIDLTPHTARVLGIGSLARVEVAPIAPGSDRASGAGLVLATADRDEAASAR